MLLKWQTNKNSPLRGSRGRIIELMLYRRFSALPSPVCSLSGCIYLVTYRHPLSLKLQDLSQMPGSWSPALYSSAQRSHMLFNWSALGVTASTTTGILTSSLLFLRFFIVIDTWLGCSSWLLLFLNMCMWVFLIYEIMTRGNCKYLSTIFLLTAVAKIRARQHQSSTFATY